MPDRDRSVTPEIALDHYWDAILADAHASEEDLDPGLAATVQRVHALDAASSPRPAFAATLWEDLMSAQTKGATISTQPGFPLHVRPLSALSRRFAATPSGPTSRLAAAILLIVLLAGSAFAAVYPLRLWDSERLPVAAPTGNSTAELATTDEGVLVDLMLTDIPPYRTEGGIGVTTYPAGGSSREFVAKTTEVMYIAAGPLTVRVEEAPEPVRVLPPGATGVTPSSNPLSAGESLTLATGSTLIAPPDAIVSLVNEGSTSSAMLDLLWATASGSSEAGGSHWTKGWGGKELDLVLPVSIVLRQVTLPVSQSLSALDSDDASQAAAVVDPNREPDLLPMADGSLRNGGDEPLEIYALTVTSGAQMAQASPAAQSPDAAGQFEFQWKFTGESDSIEQAYGLGIDPEGNVWVSEAAKDRFQVIAPDGTFRETWGTPGSGDGEFEFLSTASGFGRAYGDIAFDAEGNIYVADTGNFRVQQFAPDRTFVRSWGSEGRESGQFLAPSGIAIGANGVVYVSDETRSDLQMFALDGQYLGTIGEKGTADGQFTVPGGVTVDAAGDVWVADWSGRRIQRFTSSGDWVDTWENSGPDDEGGLRNPNDVAVDDRGRVYVVSDFNSRLHAFSVDGRFLATIGGAGSDPEEFSDPLGIALGKDGTVYVSDLNGVQAFRFVQP
jgi:sugar lactone lactonase YvrE